MKTMRIAGAVMVWLALAVGARSQGTVTISDAEAMSNVGATVTVCGVVADAKFDGDSRQKPTFLNFGGVHPNNTFTVVIMGEYRALFDVPPEAAYKGRKICVTGVIRKFKDKPEIQVTDPAQIAVADGAAVGAAVTEPVVEEAAPVVVDEEASATL